MSQPSFTFRWATFVFRCAPFVAAASLVAGCTVNIARSGDDGQGAQALNDNINWPPNAYALENPETDESVQISPAGGGPAAPVMQGGMMAVSVPFNAPNANVVGVGVRFGDSGKIMTIPTSTMGRTSGTLSANIPVPPEICGMLSKICHDIKCYEFAVTSVGKISRANIMSLALMCANCSEPSCKDLLPNMCFDPSQENCSPAGPCAREGGSSVIQSCASINGSCVTGYYVTSGGRRFDCGSCQPPCLEAAEAAVEYCGN
jgi:hypothetical protein